MFDEMLGEQGEQCRLPYKRLLNWLDQQDLKKLHKQSGLAEELFRKIGITFKKERKKLKFFHLLNWDV